MTRLVCTTLISLFLLSACATRTSRPDAIAPTTSPGSADSITDLPAANDNLNAVAWTQTSVKHDLIYREVYRNATDRLSKR